MSLWLELVLGYFGVGTLTSIGCGIYEVRRGARQAATNDVTDHDPFKGMGPFVAATMFLWPPVVVFVIATYGYKLVLLKPIKKLARIDTLPEIQEQKRKQLEKELELNDT